MHVKAHKKQREKPRTNWLSRDKIPRLIKWQVHDPGLEKRQVLKGNGHCESQSSRPRAEALPTLLSLASHELTFMSHSICATYLGSTISHEEVRSQRVT